MKKSSGIGAISAFALIAGASTAFAADTFNRVSLGGNWSSAGVSISADQLVGGNNTYGIYIPANSDTAGSAVIYLNDTNLAYGAVILGNIAGSSDAYVKIQNNGGSNTFTNGAFYTGINGTTGPFFTLDAPVPSPATLDVAFCTNTAWMRITSAAGVQTYKYNYKTNFGNGGGLGTYGTASLDNYVPYVGGCAALQTAMPHARLITDKDAVRDPSK